MLLCACNEAKTESTQVIREKKERKKEREEVLAKKQEVVTESTREVSLCVQVLVSTRVYGHCDRNTCFCLRIRLCLSLSVSSVLNPKRFLRISSVEYYSVPAKYTEKKSP